MLKKSYLPINRLQHIPKILTKQACKPHKTTNCVANKYFDQSNKTTQTALLHQKQQHYKVKQNVTNVVFIGIFR